MTIYPLDTLLSRFGTNLLFHVQFQLLLPNTHADFSGGISAGLVFPPLEEFSQFVVIHRVKGFGIANKAEIDVLLELSCFFNDPADVGNLISGSSAFTNTSLNIWRFMVHVLLKPGLENFEHYFIGLWDECNCVVFWAFFSFVVAQRLSVCLQCRRPRFDPWVGKIPWRRKWQPTPVFLPGESHGERRLLGYSPWGRKESNRTEWLSNWLFKKKKKLVKPVTSSDCLL